MAVKIRLQRKGRKKFPFYHIVIADSRAPRDGKFIENIGIYNPMTKPATIELDRDKAYDWMTKGAQPTETVRAILRFKGVLYKKHLMDGISKGAHTEEQAVTKWNEWVEAKETKIRKRIEQTAAEKESLRQTISGAVPTKIVIKEDTPVQEKPVVKEKVEKETVEQPEVVAEATKTAEEIAPAPDAKETHKAQSDEVVTSKEEKVTDEVTPPTNVEVKTEAPAAEVSQKEESTSEVTADIEEIVEAKEEEAKEVEVNEEEVNEEEVNEEEVNEEKASTEEISTEGEKPADEEKPADVA